MKTTITVLFTLTVFMILSCSKKESDNSSNNNNNNTSCGAGVLCGSVDGSSYVANTFNATGVQYWEKGSYAVYSNAGGGILTIWGGRSSTKNFIDLYAVSPSQGKTFNLSDGNLACTYGYGPDVSANLALYQWASNGSNLSGTLKLTKFDTVNKKVSGTFDNFTVFAQDNQSPASYTITNGSFTDLTLLTLKSAK